MKLYLLTYSPLANLEQQQALTKKIDEDPIVRDWWHFLETTYLLISDYALEALAEKTKVWLPGHRHLVLEVHLARAEGLLPKEAWDWINLKASATALAGAPHQ